jgi:long-chain acyl-CoA synthetase
VVLSQHGMLWVAAAGWLPFLDLGPEDYVLCPLPLFHSYPLDFLLAVLAVGGREHIMERFSTEQALRLLHEEPFTMLLGVPTTFSYLAEGHEKSGPAPRGTLRVCVTAGAIMPREIWERTERALGAPVVDAYGATETSTAVTISPPEGTHEPGTGGVQILGFGVRVVDPASGKDVASGEEGELIVRGPGVMLGYHAVRRRRGTLCATAGTAPEISLASTMSAS